MVGAKQAKGKIQVIRIYIRRSVGRLHNQSGQALTELALVAPLLLWVLLAVFSLAEAGRRKAAVERAAAAAARVAVVRPDLAPNTALAVLRAADAVSDSKDVKTAIIRAPGIIPGGAVRVLVSLRYRPRMGFGWRPSFDLKSDYVVDRWKNSVFFSLPEPADAGKGKKGNIGL